MNIDVKTPDYVVQLAKDLRNNLTVFEQIIWAKLKKKQVAGFRFRCQHPIYRYILDFYCHEKLLAIEIDGDIHKERKDYDDYRDEFMLSLGIKTLRFNNNEIIHDVENVINDIKVELREHCS